MPLAQGGLPEPGARIYGTVAINGVLVVRDDSRIRDQKTFTISQRGLSSRINFGVIETNAASFPNRFYRAIGP